MVYLLLMASIPLDSCIRSLEGNGSRTGAPDGGYWFRCSDFADFQVLPSIG
jgi:hypothetical protein